jgi:hypothetical protein
VLGERVVAAAPSALFFQKNPWGQLFRAAAFNEASEKSGKVDAEWVSYERARERELARDVGAI